MRGDYQKTLFFFNDWFAPKPNRPPLALYIPILCLKCDNFYTVPPETDERQYLVLIENHVTLSTSENIRVYEARCESDTENTYNHKNKVYSLSPTKHGEASNSEESESGSPDKKKKKRGGFKKREPTQAMRDGINHLYYDLETDTGPDGEMICYMVCVVGKIQNPQNLSEIIDIELDFCSEPDPLNPEYPDNQAME